MQHYVLGYLVSQLFAQSGLTEKGISFISLAQRVGIDPSIMGKMDSYLNLEQLNKSVNLLYELTDVPHIGLQMAEKMTYAQLDVLGHLVIASHTLGDAVNQFITYKDLLFSYLKISLEEKDKYAILQCHLEDSDQLVKPFFHSEMIIGSIVSIGRALIGNDLKLVGIQFQHKAPSYKKIYENFFKVPVLFNAESNQIIAEKDILQYELPHEDSQYYSKLRQMAEERLYQLKKQKSFSGKVLEYMEENLDRQIPALEDIATHFKITSRTLQRKLQEDGFSFVELRDHLRHRLSKRMLLDEKMKIEEVSQRLGFSYPANFYLSFKRWEGVSPNDYRTQQLDKKKLS